MLYVHKTGMRRTAKIFNLDIPVSKLKSRPVN